MKKIYFSPALIVDDYTPDTAISASCAECYPINSAEIPDACIKCTGVDQQYDFDHVGSQGDPSWYVCFDPGMEGCP